MRRRYFSPHVWSPIFRYSLNAVRVFVVLAVVQGLTPAPPRVHLGPRQTVDTRHPEVCVHTRLTDEIEEWKIQRTLSMVREMGAETIVEFFPWPYLEIQPGQYDWTHAERIIRHADNQGLTVIARLGLVPEWARPPVVEKVTTFNYLPYEHFDTFANFVGAFVEHFKGQVGAIIVWNEPNLSGEWGGRPVDPEGYTELLRLSYEAAHNANPDIMVLGGALAPTVETVESGGGLNEFEYLSRMYEAGAADYFDVLAAHTYGFTVPPQDEPDPSVINFRRIELLHDIMEQYGDADTPVFITESGWNDDPRWVYAVRPGQRLTYTLDAFQMVQEWPWADKLCLWIFRQPTDLQNRRDAYFALVSSTFYPKPIYEAIQAYARGWESPYLQ